ncbi:MbtH family NRPS accessory protein [Pseudosulfitobacter sp. SM2401]|uniref:MbtH family protein n=1 Tax=Pseudosulfitobacter sp. SM2401 TaxID=3350098 RepID=UPI0036F2140A
MTNPEARQRLWLVLRNTEGRYSVARASHPVPAGWNPVGQPAPRADCLAQIGKIWTDMRPQALQETLS